MLGLRSASDVLILEDPKFQDSMSVTWSADDIAQLLSSTFSPSVSLSKGKSRVSGQPVTTIDVLITFDDHGISSHPNHISLYHGARRWLSLLNAGRSDGSRPVVLYTLTSVNIFRKYISFVDALFTMVVGVSRAIGPRRGKKGEEPPSLLYVSNFSQYCRGQKAMVEAHKSQMVWFRWGWISLGRYMVVNGLERETIIQ